MSTAIRNDAEATAATELLRRRNAGESTREKRTSLQSEKEGNDGRERLRPVWSLWPRCWLVPNHSHTGYLLP